MDKKKVVIILILIIAVVTILIYNYKIDPYYFRSKTEIEKIHLSCIPGISIIDSTAIIKIGIINIFLAWHDKLPFNITEKIKNNNSILMITWEPYLKNNKKKSILTDITNGIHDDLINDFAVSIKNYRHPVLLRWGHEMNGNWYSWSGTHNSRNPNLYIKAYQYIHNVFKKQNVNNVKFIFSVNHKDVPSNNWNKFENYYPGDNYVDILGIDMYNWGETKIRGNNKKFKWKNPKSILIESYERIINAYPDKPIIISEIASSSKGGDKILWIQDFLYLLTDRFSAVKAFVWFDINKESDWSVSQDNNIWQVFNKEIKKPYYSNNINNFVVWIYKD
ncbi:hypothetical protein HY745_10695 [Candidatus Desantisbacteria bacterium]|nr:hypothetical protein [Candidatus Desantisbacteria bacterium]